MAFVAGNFNARSSLRARASGQQHWTFDAIADLLITVIAADYFLLKFQELSVDDIIHASTLGGTYQLKVTASSVTTVTVEMAESVQALSGAGAVDTIAYTTEVTSTGVDALTLIDGAVGQRKRIIMIVDGGTATLTPTTGLGYSTIAFADAGDRVILEMASAGGWAIVGSGGLAGGPVAA